MQTTYENFRYRYDKKENPYNRGMLSNFREVFFSRIPPSMNDFRAIVKEDDVVITETAGQNFMGGIRASSKEKIDIEMGSDLVDSNGLVIPDLLRHLEFDDIEDNIKIKERSERFDSGPFIAPLEPTADATVSEHKGL